MNTKKSKLIPPNCWKKEKSIHSNGITKQEKNGVQELNQAKLQIVSRKKFPILAPKQIIHF